MASAAGAPVASAVAVGGFDADRAELRRDRSDDLAQVAWNAIGRCARPSVIAPCETREAKPERVFAFGKLPVVFGSLSSSCEGKLTY